MDFNTNLPKKDGGSKSKKKKKKDRSSRTEPSAEGDGLASAIDTLFPSFDAPPRRTSSRVEDGKKPAASFPHTETLNQMEQDVLAKSRASAPRQTGNVAGVGVGRVVQSRPTSSSMASGADRATGLNQLEADLLIKNRARSSGPATAELGAGTAAGGVGTSPSSLCIVCGLPGRDRCSKCHVATYCCRAHQIVDWKARHKAVCRCVATAAAGVCALTVHS